jgi:hypothetical protein
MASDQSTPGSTPECDDCRGLVGAGRSVGPHKNLKRVSSHGGANPGGTVYDDRYECTACGKEWLHETGSGGFGWI